MNLSNLDAKDLQAIRNLNFAQHYLTEALFWIQPDDDLRDEIAHLNRKIEELRIEYEKFKTSSFYRK